MEALRNHVQHQGIPIHSVTYDSQWIGVGQDRMMEFTVDIYAQRENLAANEKFKKSILAELSGDVDLKATCRQYVESISAINEIARDLARKSTTSARERVRAAHQRYAEIYQESLIGLTAFALSGEETVSSIPLLLDWDDVRLKLQSRNAKLVNLAKRYVSGRLSARKKS